jgi:hypothetical protein
LNFAKENLESSCSVVTGERDDLLNQIKDVKSEADELRADLLKHKELISFINKLSAENAAAAAANKK